MTTTASHRTAPPAPAEISRLGMREAERQALLLRVPAQSGEGAGRPINDPATQRPAARAA